ncbi:UNVERIFIED_CONTAM: hypothetical protein Sangu_1541000 [Sesamum angustifolium]|uniref:Uncharacterized protein n=1 Tax=Sesamum angustifolium TaxID=2727405 RepID=A0AAW2MTF9_9LAMI
MSGHGATLWANCEAMSKGKKACWACHVGSLRDVGISNGPRTYDAVILGPGIKDDHDEGMRRRCTK